LDAIVASLISFAQQIMPNSRTHSDKEDDQVQWWPHLVQSGTVVASGAVVASEIFTDKAKKP